MAVKRDADLLDAAHLAKAARISENSQKQQPVVNSARTTERNKMFFAPGDEKEQNKLGNDLVDWANLETSLFLSEFPKARHLWSRSFYNIAKKNEYFALCLGYAKDRIGERLQVRLLAEKIQGSQEYLIKQLSKVEELWIQQYEESLASKDKQVDPIININIPHIGTTKGESK